MKKILYLASKNPGKINEYKKMLGKINCQLLLQPNDIDVIEDGNNFKENALKRVRLGVLINKLIEENNISVDNDTLKKEIEDKSKSFKDPEQYVNWIYGNEEQLKNIESLVLEDKVAEYLEAKSKVEEESLSFEEVVSMG